MKIRLSQNFSALFAHVRFAYKIRKPTLIKGSIFLLAAIFGCMGEIKVTEWREITLF